MPNQKRKLGLAEQIKADMVDYVGPLFEELKTDFGHLKTKMGTLETKVGGLETKMGQLETKVLQETRHLGVLMETMQSEVTTALQASSSVLRNENIFKDHSGRIETLETDVKSIKTILKIVKI